MRGMYKCKVYIATPHISIDGGREGRGKTVGGGEQAPALFTPCAQPPPPPPHTHHLTVCKVISASNLQRGTCPFH